MNIYSSFMLLAIIITDLGPYPSTFEWMIFAILKLPTCNRCLQISNSLFLHWFSGVVKSRWFTAGWFATSWTRLGCVKEYTLDRDALHQTKRRIKEHETPNSQPGEVQPALSFRAWHPYSTSGGEGSDCLVCGIIPSCLTLCYPRPVSTAVTDVTYDYYIFHLVF